MAVEPDVRIVCWRRVLGDDAVGGSLMHCCALCFWLVRHDILTKRQLAVAGSPCTWEGAQTLDARVLRAARGLYGVAVTEESAHLPVGIQ